MPPRLSRAAAGLLGSALLAGGLASPSAAQSVEELGSLSIEELSRLEVNSASKRAQPVGQAPTSIYLITSDLIERSAANSLPEALRLAPNINVQQFDARQYAVSARGFGGFESANKLLVMIDGRSVYTTLHSGVFWELHAPLLEDIQQIEVISGPGGTLFGPNAVNGVITVTSRSAHDTIGGLVRGTAGANERTAAARYGVRLGESAALRVYAHGWDREDMPATPALTVNDRFKGIQAGFRADVGSLDDGLTLQGDLLRSDTGQIPGDGDRAANLLARWTSPLSAETSLQLQAYWDYYKREFMLVEDVGTTFDAAAQLNIATGAHNVVIGAGVRTTRDRFINRLNDFRLDPERRRLWIANAFIQDEIALSAQLSLIAGLKVEQSSFSGIELLPNLRLAWRPNERNLLWAAVSRAVRTPSRIDRELLAPIILDPAPDFAPEKLIAIEAGYRGQIGQDTALSLSLFYNIYHDLRTTESAGAAFLPLQLKNGLEGQNYGLEAWISQQLTGWWRVNVGASVLGEDFRLKAARVDFSNFATLGAYPAYQLLVRSEMELTDRLSLNTSLRAIDDLERPSSPAYVEADARVAWRMSEQLQFYLAGTNLLHKSHLETSEPARAQRIERSIYFGTTVRF